ncbi:MAG: response regulator transcription factor [Armatimonadota bacterium]|nr:response regulator transcription factor [Armatimonadota bacterium]MDR7444325.1 response regulator transcription factor [Armatimonadota bacterium]MDR7569684.1 response regulator transcription factor [Armatimonadota bacterium]MDR7614812.1 response regulator transcription factor [Armatimonadota bacterium]
MREGQPRILLIEDDEALADPLQEALAEEGFRILYAATGEEGLRKLSEVSVDLVVLDVMLPDVEGFSLCRAIRQRSDVPILMLTARTHELDRVTGLEMGADDYVGKPFSLRELVARIRALLRRRELDRGALPASGDRMAIGAILLDRVARRVWKAGQEVPLRPREFELLRVLMEEAGKALSRQELLDRVWGSNWVGDPRTLDVHIRWLREKLEDDPTRPRYIQTVRGYGYRFEVEGGP